MTGSPFASVSGLVRGSVQCVLLSHPGEVTADEVSIWERNRLVDKHGKETLVQIVWWRFESHDGWPDYYVVAWRLEKDCKCEPRKVDGWWVGKFRDGKDKVDRTIRARLYKETETTIDFEVDDRKRLPEGERSGLKRR